MSKSSTVRVSAELLEEMRRQHPGASIRHLTDEAFRAALFDWGEDTIVRRRMASELRRLATEIDGVQ